MLTIHAKGKSPFLMDLTFESERSFNHFYWNMAYLIALHTVIHNNHLGHYFKLMIYN